MYPRTQASTSLSVHLQLPVPVTQRRSAQAQTSRRGFQSAASRWRSIKAYVKRTLAAPDVPSSSALVESIITETVSSPAPPSKEAEQHWTSDEVDEVVVDRSWSDDSETETHSDADSASSRGDATVAEVESLPVAHPKGLGRVWHGIKEFYMPRFGEPEETLYQKEMWGQTKRLSLWASVFFIASCVSAIISLSSPIVLADKIFYHGISPFLSLPIVFMCAYDYPYDHPFIFQAFLGISTWSWPYYEILSAFLCGFYSIQDRHFTCGQKDFLTTFYYTSALQAVALFGTSLKRLPATIGAFGFLILTCESSFFYLCANMDPDILNFIIFECVLLYMHSQKEHSSRKLFWLRNQLKLAFQRTRKAQMNERQAADSKRRLTSYVFHDKSLLNNSAVLAVQNMASRPIAKDHEVEFSALEGSLSMMSKVLNDVLDFNRMDSGKLESLSRPYAFHKVLRSLFIPLRLAADARNLEFVTDLDMRIDEVARRAAYHHTNATPEEITQHLKDQPSGEAVMGVVVGDETRLRQIITNLASNACKFTSAGGKLTITTRLVVPGPDVPMAALSPPPTMADTKSLTDSSLDLHNEANPPDPPKSQPLERIVVRIEITDTGSGIQPRDMVECKLFSAFNQTEQGRQQGGKGTGLGLALVRQIVKLSGGRLGLRSKVGVGSTFWVELPLGVGRKAMTPCEPEPSTPPIIRHTLPILETRSQGSHASASSVAEAVDAAAMVAARPLPTSSRSSSALHGLMDQAGRYELTLSRFDSHSSVPTRMIGDASTGTDYPLPPRSQSEDEHEPEPASTVAPPLEARQDTDETLRPRRAGAAVRPTYVHLPTPQSFDLASHAQVGTPSPPLGLRVLVVDDDAMTRMLMTRMLERMGCRVSTAENGEVALSRIVGAQTPAPTSEIAAEQPPEIEIVSQDPPRFAVIFLDNQMPKLSGVKMVERLRQMRGRRDFVVGVTAGNALLTDQKEYLDAGADHVLTKPVLEASLRSMLALAGERRDLKGSLGDGTML
ncbi:hypothetical protein B0H15DRAFT_778280 [Mycena belliarum]|uniref:Uncharacterized protein n=1 Tax=Mycena belliarum TaxID=1033014 RepID=A0AAD6XS55_9AGAR|nr:hypothetical protein B0H15DRAFT_778280 [Mycena belliae]